MWKHTYADCLSYIDSYWDRVIHTRGAHLAEKWLSVFVPGLQRSVRHRFIEVPRAYVTPNDRKFAHIFYWDTFFIFRGLMGTKRQWIMKEMVENFIHLFKIYGLIPNLNAPMGLGRTQPPFFSSMILDVYRHDKRSRFSLMGEDRNKWFGRAMKIAKEEYALVWIDEENLYHHRVAGQILARYGDRDVGYAHSSELESGWDFTSRFYNRCNEFLPIDLNCYLYKYELDFAEASQLLGRQKEEMRWTALAAERKQSINELMWNEEDGFFFDYGWHYERKSVFLSLAGFVPLWAGLADANQAQKMVKKLSAFETPFGLAITAKESLASPIDLSKIQRRFHPAIKEIIDPKQWDYPNIWLPLEYLTVIGLLRYGFQEEAKRIMTSSVKAHADLFRKYGTFFEKINGENGEPSETFVYENQTGFGWTNAVFYRYVQILDHLEEQKNLYREPKAEVPPFDLVIMH